jgi:hypothetical protein
MQQIPIDLQGKGEEKRVATLSLFLNHICHLSLNGWTVPRIHSTRGCDPHRHFHQLTADIIVSLISAIAITEILD